MLILRGTGRAEIVGATLESIAYQTVDVVQTMTLEANLSFDCLKVDGGAVSNNFLMQFQADLLDRPVERPLQIETTALGAAYLAGLTVGVWSDMAELEKYRKVDQVFTPSMSTSIRQEKLAGWKTAVDQVIKVQ